MCLQVICQWKKRTLFDYFFFRDMSEDHLNTNTILNKRIYPRPLIECLDVESTFGKRKKNKTFEKNKSSKNLLYYLMIKILLLLFSAWKYWTNR